MSPLHPVQLLQTVRATRRAVADAPVPPGWAREAAKTQLRLASGRVERDDGLVQVKVGRFKVTGFSIPSLAFLHREIFVDLQYYFSTDVRDPYIVDGGSNSSSRRSIRMRAFLPSSLHSVRTICWFATSRRMGYEMSRCTGRLSDAKTARCRSSKTPKIPQPSA